jgi:hypothetical protein
MTNWGPIARSFVPCPCIALCIIIALQLTQLIQLFGLLCPVTLAGAFRAFLGVPQCLSLSLCLFIFRRIGALVPRDCLRNLTHVRRVGNVSGNRSGRHRGCLLGFQGLLDTGHREKVRTHRPTDCHTQLELCVLAESHLR